MVPIGLRERLTFANIVSVTALFVALGGSAWAVSAVGSRDILANAVRSRHIQDGAVSSAEVLDGSLLPVDFAESVPVAGAAGPEGPVGPQGPTGSTGSTGDSGSPDTAPQVLAKVKTVDGPGSGLDADTIDGLGSSAFARSSGVQTFSHSYDDGPGNNVGTLETMLYNANVVIEVFGVCYDNRTPGGTDEAIIYARAPAQSSVSIIRSDGTTTDLADFQQTQVVSLSTPDIPAATNKLQSATLIVATPHGGVLSAQVSAEVNDTVSGSDCAFAATGLTQ